jgi:hypothetical protein
VAENKSEVGNTVLKRRRASTDTSAAGYVIQAGAHAPVAQLRLMDSASWEIFVEECCLPLQGTTYQIVKRLGMPGDKGRDVEAIVTLPRRQHGWDLYQCKYFKGPVAPSDFLPEMASFFSHLVRKSYPEPRAYFICAPHDCGVDLHDLLVSEPEDFKAVFLRAWVDGNRGLKKNLTPAIKAVVESFDFSRFKEMSARTLVEMHSKNQSAHFKRFGIKPKRLNDPVVPPSPRKHEQKYVQALLAVYSEHAAHSVDCDGLTGTDYEEHFSACRSEFYSAEGLKRFSRDIFPGEFDAFLGTMLKTVRSTVSLPTHKTGLERLCATTERSYQLKMADSPLSESLRSPDMPGACHHLANAGKLKWVK